jgi:HSP20 family protein
VDKPTLLPVLLFPGVTAGDDTWHPSVDIYRTRSGWLLKFDLAGVRPEDIGIQVQGCRITVSGTRRDWVLEEGWSYYSMEISYNRFERTIQLPCELASPRTRVDYQYGILIIRVETEEVDG